jgi:hypothetical protein
MGRPNILLITTDQQRFDGLGINGNAVLRTPNLDHLAARGVNFTRAYTTCPSCIAARRSILTGQFPVTHGLVGYEDGLEWDPPFTLPGLLGRNVQFSILNVQIRANVQNPGLVQNGGWAHIMGEIRLFWISPMIP